MNTKLLFGLLLICMTLAFTSCSMQNAEVDSASGKLQITDNEPGEIDSKELASQNLEGSILENFQDSADQWFAPKDEYEQSDVFSHSDLDLDKYIEAIENGSLKALSEMDNPAAYLQELIPYNIDEPDSSIIEVIYSFTDKSGKRHEVSEDFLIIPE